MNLVTRPVEVDDLPELAPIDEAYARSHALDPALTSASLAFYARTGHAFVACEGPDARAFALAQAVWDGRRPTVRLVRLAGASDARRALAEAVVKSAYDAAVYDLAAEVPHGDAELADLLAATGWRSRPVARFDRVLGSRGGPGSTVGPGAAGGAA